MAENLTPSVYQHFLVFDSHEIFQWIQDQINYRGEISAVNFADADEVTTFMNDIMSNVAYLPNGQFMPSMIDVVLRDADQYLSEKFTEFQRSLWRIAVDELVKQFRRWNLYESTTGVHNYDFEEMLGNNLLLKFYGDGVM